jgi:hypothetical protein
LVVCSNSPLAPGFGLVRLYLHALFLYHDHVLLALSTLVA